MNPQTNAPNTGQIPDAGLSLPAIDPAAQTPAPPVPVNPGQTTATPAAVPAAATPQDPSVPATGTATTAAPTPASAPMASTDSNTPMIADDADLIEKEWVEKAKQLVDQTKNDPYTQNKEINKFKADYIKKRYNKDIALSNE